MDTLMQVGRGAQAKVWSLSIGEALREALLNGLYSSIVHFLKRPPKMAGYEGEFIKVPVVLVTSREQ